MKSLSSLLKELDSYQIKVRLVDGGLKIFRPEAWATWEDAPEACRPFLSELKARKDEMAIFLEWDEEKAFQTWRIMLDHLNEKYLPGALRWAEKHMPEAEKQLGAAEDMFEQAFREKDMATVYYAAATFEDAMERIIEAYKGCGQDGQVVGKV